MWRFPLLPILFPLPPISLHSLCEEETESMQLTFDISFILFSSIVVTGRKKLFFISTYLVQFFFLFLWDNVHVRRSPSPFRFCAATLY